jgi:hypothetical protein
MVDLCSGGGVRFVEHGPDSWFGLLPPGEPPIQVLVLEPEPLAEAQSSFALLGMHALHVSFLYLIAKLV